MKPAAGQVEKLYVTVGVYLGYALAQYCELLVSRMSQDGCASFREQPGQSAKKHDDDGEILCPRFYKIDHVMILGRVSKGAGGDIMLSTA